MEIFTFILGFKRFSSRAGFPKGKLNTEYGVDYQVCAVGAHYMHGKVERKIRQIKESMARSLDRYELSTIGWETLGAKIANCINDMPIGVINRSPVETVDITGRYDKVIQSNNEIFGLNVG